MSIFKCKMCGGTLEIQNETVATCEYCGTQQTLPRLDDDRRANLYDRANHFRRNNEFDKAMGIYEQILNDDRTDAEAYWSLVLCRYGIEYVEDPASRKRVPTVNRAQFTSIFDDDNYKSALQYADDAQRRVYEEEAGAINEIQKGILAISQKEDPFDVFICYKESDNNGRRTPDSVLAQDLYYQLKQEGFKVFFSRITLEDKLGSAYEPYIFAALNSAKVMVALGTKPEYFKAVWVRNEWSRYLSLIKQGQKKILIPAYKDMDPYDLPDEFSHLQAQDMSKLGFMQDLIRGIKKITQADTPQTAVVKETVIAAGSVNTAPLLKRAFMFLEDRDWAAADEYCEKVLDIDPENAQAYLGKLMAELRVKKLEDLRNQASRFDTKNSYLKIMRFGDDALTSTLAEYTSYIVDRNEKARIDGIYCEAQTVMNTASTDAAYKKAGDLFNRVSDYKDSAQMAQECYEKAKECIYNQAEKIMTAGTTEKAFHNAAHQFESLGDFRDAAEKVKQCYQKAEGIQKDAIYDKAIKKARSNADNRYEEALKIFATIPGWKDADEKAEKCRQKIEEIKAKKEADRLEKERRAEIERKEAEIRAKKAKKIALILTPIFCVAFITYLILSTVIIPSNKYREATALMNEGKYREASVIFESISTHKDSKAKALQCRNEHNYISATALLDAGNVADAYELFHALGDYKDSATTASSIYHKRNLAILNAANIGENVIFGRYEQDNITSNGVEDIEWIVLAKEDNKVLLLSKYALTRLPYNTSRTNVTWESCTLRRWLNNDFLSTAFSVEEMAMIHIAAESAGKASADSTNTENATNDSVFLLNVAQAEQYCVPDSIKQCAPTKYATAQGTYAVYDWWLRSGEQSKYAPYVNRNGSISTGCYVNNSYTNVRPAMWVDLDIAIYDIASGNEKYSNALTLMDAEKYTEAIAILETLGNFRDSKDKMAQCYTGIDYLNAIAWMDAGKTVEAYETLLALDGFKDSAKKADSIVRKYMAKKLPSVKVGDSIVFGSYEQDGDTSNGKERIEWIVLAKKSDRVLVISKYALAQMQYYPDRTNVTWETSALRKWLNNDFLNTAFTANEKAMIPTVTVSADRNPQYNKSAGSSTKDKVYLLSITEADNYFAFSSERKCVPTQYAVSQGASKNSCSWWLRTPGTTYYGYYTAYVNSAGSVYNYGASATTKYGIRPVLWIESD